MLLSKQSRKKTCLHSVSSCLLCIEFRGESCKKNGPSVVENEAEQNENHERAKKSEGDLLNSSTVHVIFDLESISFKPTKKKTQNENRSQLPVVYVVFFQMLYIVGCVFMPLIFHTHT